MSSYDRELNALYQINRILKESDTPPTLSIEKIYDYLFKNEGFRNHIFNLSSLDLWSNEALQRALDYAEDIIAIYTRIYYDPRIIPVTYYKRERRIRRHLDGLFSLIFKELISRSGQVPIPELITEEPIYYLKQKARERSFPKSRDGLASLEVLKSRFHLDLSRRLAS